MNRHIERLLTSMFLVTLVAAACPRREKPTAASRSAAPSELGVKAVAQQTRYWCWAAAAEMVMRYVGGEKRTISQAQQAADAALPEVVTCVKDRCREDQPELCRKGGYPKFDFAGYDFDTPIACSDGLTFEHLKEELAAKRPVAYSYSYDKDGAHMRVIIGTGRNDAGLDTLRVIDPKSTDYLRCTPNQPGAVTYLDYLTNHDRTIYCVQVKGGKDPCKPCDLPADRPKVRERGYTSAESAARGAFEQFPEVLAALKRNESLDVGPGADEAIFATANVRRAKEADLDGITLIRPPTKRRVFPVRDKDGWFGLVTVQRTSDEPEAWEPVSMFEDLRAGDIQRLLVEHDTATTEPLRFLIVPGLNLEFLLGADGTLISLASEPPPLAIEPKETLGLVEFARRFWPIAKTLNSYPT